MLPIPGDACHIAGRSQAVMQEGSYFSSLGMQCETGTCVYEDLAPVHHHHRRGDKGVLHWLDENQAELVIGLMWFCLILVLIIVTLSIRRDKRRSLQRAEEWARGHDYRDGAPGAPLLTCRGVI